MKKAISLNLTNASSSFTQRSSRIDKKRKKQIEIPDVPSPQDPFADIKYPANMRPKTPLPKCAKSYTQLRATKRIAEQTSYQKQGMQPMFAPQSIQILGNYQNNLVTTPREEKFDVDFDGFMLELSEKPLIPTIEDFIRTHYKANTVIYWQTVPSVNLLISTRLQKTVSPKSSLLGYAFFERKIIKVPMAMKHPAYDPNVDGQIINPYAFLIFFPLFDYRNNLVSIIEISKKHADASFSDKDFIYLELFQRKFHAFSKWILTNTIQDKVLLEFINLMDIDQYVLSFQMKMSEMFHCKSAEIWTYNKQMEELSVYQGANVFNVNFQKAGVVNYVISKCQLFNIENVKLCSSYNPEQDGEDGDPFLGIPVVDPNTNIIILIALRGNKTQTIFSIDDEILIKKIAPFITLGFSNSLKDHGTQISDSQNANFLASVVTSLPVANERKTMNDLLDKTMTSLILLTKASRATFYVVSKKDNCIHSIYQTGLSQPLTLQIGKGHAGTAAYRGTVINCADAYEDSKFDSSFDASTGFKTNTILSVPLFSVNGAVTAVVQLLNKDDKKPFSKSDVSAAKIIGTICANMIDNTNMFNRLNQLTIRTDGFTSILNKSLKGDEILAVINQSLEVLRDMLKCETINVYLVDMASDVMRDVFNYYSGEVTAEVNDSYNELIGNPVYKNDSFLQQIPENPFDEPSQIPLKRKNSRKSSSYFMNLSSSGSANAFKQNSCECLSISTGASAYCIKTGEAFFVNDVYHDARCTNEVFSSICIAPIVIRPNQPIGILRAINKIFDDGDLDSIKIFASFISFLVNEMNFLQYSDFGKVQYQLEKVISVVEAGKTTTPEKLRLKKEQIEKITFLNFDTITFAPNYGLLKIAFYAFDHLGLLEKYSISNTMFFIFLYNVQKNYKVEAEYYNFTHAIDMLQFLMFEINQASLHTIFRSDEILSLFISCICSHISNDGTNNAFNESLKTPYGVLFKGMDVMEMSYCVKTIHILSKPSCDLFHTFDEEGKRNSLNTIISLILSSDRTNGETVFKVREILDNSTIDLSNGLHRHLMMSLLYRAANYSPMCRPFEISTKWNEIESRQLFKLGNKEAANSLAYSSKYNSKELYNDTEYRIEQMTNYGIPVFEVLSSLLMELKPILQSAQSNLKRLTGSRRVRSDSISRRIPHPD